jgi:hypothetical protein
MVKALMQWRGALGLRWKLAAKDLEAVPRIVQLSLSQSGICRGHQLLKPVGSSARSLASTGVFFLLSLFDEQRVNVWMFGQERFGLPSPFIGRSAKACWTSCASRTAGSASALASRPNACW